MKLIKSTILLSLLMTLINISIAQEKGPVTPTSVTYTFHSAQLTLMNGDNYSLFDTPVAHTFSKSDDDFSNETLHDSTVAYGRYKSISLCFNTNVILSIHAAKYVGRSGTLISQGDYVYGQEDGSVSTTVPNTIHMINVATSNSAQNCTTTYFSKPLCVASSATSNDCLNGDEIYTSEGKINPNTGEVDLGLGAAVELQVSFLMDMLNGVIINADTGAVTSAPKVSIVLGKPGAAIHLGKWDSNGATDVSMILGNDKSILSVISSEYPGTHSEGFCSGQSNAYVTTVPSGSPLPENNINFITYFNSLSGEAAYPSTSACPDSNNCSPDGFNVFDNILQEIGSLTSVNCVDKNSNLVPSVLLDFGYASVGSGELNGPINLEIKRIVDPTNLLSICSNGKAGHMNSKPGVCTYSGSDAEGY